MNLENEGLCIKIPVITQQLMQYFSKSPQIKAESLYF